MAGTDVIVHADKTMYIHGVGSGSIVGTSTTQTLTNKTISGGTISGASLVNCTGTITASTLVNATLSGTTVNSGTITGGNIDRATLSGPTITGTVFATGANFYLGNITGGTISSSAINGGSVASATFSGTITATTATMVSGTYSSPVLQNPTISLTGSTNGDMWYQSGGVVARLPKGTAYQKLLMNSSATGPTWNTAIYYGNSSRNLTTASGTAAITGLGFRPIMVFFQGYVGTVSNFTGMDTGNIRSLNLNYDVGLHYSDQSNSLWFFASGGNYVSGQISSMDADGFTITFSRSGAPTGTGYFSFCAFP
jgi:hypothetical protein